MGEHPEACESLGIDVYKVRYTCVILSGFLAGLGGAFVTLATINQFRPSVIVGQGFIAIAAVIFGKFSPEGATKACLLFGLCSGIRSLAAQSNVVSPNLISMIPYVVTIIALVLFVGKAHTPVSYTHLQMCQIVLIWNLVMRILFSHAHGSVSYDLHADIMNLQIWRHI